LRVSRLLADRTGELPESEIVQKFASKCCEEAGMQGDPELARVPDDKISSLVTAMRDATEAIRQQRKAR